MFRAILKVPLVLIRMLLCNHSYKLVRNIHGDEINMHFPIKRSEWECVKCGNVKLKEKLGG